MITGSFIFMTPMARLQLYFTKHGHLVVKSKLVNDLGNNWKHNILLFFLEYSDTRVWRTACRNQLYLHIAENMCTDWVFQALTWVIFWHQHWSLRAFPYRARHSHCRRKPSKHLPIPQCVLYHLKVTPRVQHDSQPSRFDTSQQHPRITYIARLRMTTSCDVSIAPLSQKCGKILSGCMSVCDSHHFTYEYYTT